MVTELKLPNNYRLIEEEEMMYTEGSGIPRDWAMNSIDFALIFTGVGGWLKVAQVVGKYGKSKVAQIIVKSAQGLGWTMPYAQGLALTEFAMRFGDFSIGGAIAHALDAGDGNYNGWIF